MTKTSVFTMLAAGFQENSLFHFKPPEALFSLLRVAAPLTPFLFIFSKYIRMGLVVRPIFSILKRRGTKFHEEWRYFRAEIFFLDLFREGRRF